MVCPAGKLWSKKTFKLSYPRLKPLGPRTKKLKFIEDSKDILFMWGIIINIYCIESGSENHPVVSNSL